MFMCIICLLHLQAMFNIEMDLSSYFTCFHVLKLLLFIAALITYGIYLSYMFVLFEIKIFNIFKYDGSMSLISTTPYVFSVGVHTHGSAIRGRMPPPAILLPAPRARRRGQPPRPQLPFPCPHVLHCSRIHGIAPFHPWQPAQDSSLQPRPQIMRLPLPSMAAAPALRNSSHTPQTRTAAEPATPLSMSSRPPL
jgi:hypothetical protein